MEPELVGAITAAATATTIHEILAKAKECREKELHKFQHNAVKIDEITEVARGALSRVSDVIDQAMNSSDAQAFTKQIGKDFQGLGKYFVTDCEAATHELKVPLAFRHFRFAIDDKIKEIMDASPHFLPVGSDSFPVVLDGQGTPGKYNLTGVSRSDFIVLYFSNTKGQKDLTDRVRKTVAKTQNQRAKVLAENLASGKTVPPKPTAKYPKVMPMPVMGMPVEGFLPKGICGATISEDSSNFSPCSGGAGKPIMRVDWKPSRSSLFGKIDSANVGRSLIDLHRPSVSSPAVVDVPALGSGSPLIANGGFFGIILIVGCVLSFLIGRHSKKAKTVYLVEEDQY